MKFPQFAHKSPQIMQNPHLLICALNKYFQIPDHKQSTPGNYSKLRRFHTFRPQFCELREICTICTRYGMTRNSRMNPVNPGNYSELRRFCTICPHSRQITQNSRYLYTNVTYHLITIMHLVIAPYPLMHTYLHIPRLVSHYYVL